MICEHCGAGNADGAAYCTRCSIRLGAAGRVRPAMPLPPPVQAAIGMGAPVPRSGRLSGSAVAALCAGVAGRPQPIAPAGAPSPRVRAMPGPARARDGQGANTVAPPWGWAMGGLLLCVTLAFVSQPLSRYVAAQADGLALPSTMDDMRPPSATGSPESEPSAPAPGQPDAARAAAARELSNAINAELHRLDVDTVNVQVRPDGIATASGQVASAVDRDAVLRWLAEIPGVTGVVDELQVETRAPVEPPAPMAAVPAPEPERKAPPAAEPPAPRPAPRAVAPAEPPARVQAPPPDASTIARTVQRELARLALANITVEVDPSLHVTLRGTATDANKKAQALAAARAATPGGRVRDLVFVVEE